MKDLGSYVLRHATEKDLNRILQFSIDFLHAHNANRTLQKITDTVKRRKYFLVESEKSRNIVATSAVFDHREGRYRQAGGSRVTHIGGFGIHHALHRIRAVHEQIMDDDFTEYFSAIDDGNERSIANAKEVGFSDWECPAVDLEYEAITVSAKKLNFFRLDRKKVPSMAEWILSNQEGIDLTRINRATKEQEKIRLSFQIETLCYYKPMLESLAFG